MVLASDVRAVPLVAQDLYASGDGLVSRDAARGIDWLDLTLTQGQSIDDVLQGAGGWISQGWRLATNSEVCGLAGEAMAPGVVACPTEFSSVSIFYDDRAVDIVNLFGITSHGDYEQISASGLFDDGDLSDGESAAAAYSFLIGPVNGEQSGFNLAENLGPSIFMRSEAYGVFLVRPIPEPGTGLLVALGLSVLRRRPTKA